MGCSVGRPQQEPDAEDAERGGGLRGRGERGHRKGGRDGERRAPRVYGGERLPGPLLGAEGWEGRAYEVPRPPGCQGHCRMDQQAGRHRRKGLEEEEEGDWAAVVSSGARAMGAAEACGLRADASAAPTIPMACLNTGPCPNRAFSGFY